MYLLVFGSTIFPLPSFTIASNAPFGLSTQLVSALTISMLIENLLTTGAIVDRPVAAEGRVIVQPSFSATLNVDHRHFDGDGAARILESFQSALNESIAWAVHKEKLDA